MTRSIRVALLTFTTGFLVEGATEVYQFFSVGYLGQGWIGLYYVGLVTTGLGFYFIFRGRHEWTELHRKSVRHGHRLLWTAVALFVGAAVTITVLGLLGIGRSGAAPPLWLVGIVGGLVGLAFGNFFLSLVMTVIRLVGSVGKLLAWTAFVWSLGVSVLAGAVVADRLLSLLREFFTNPAGLFVSFGPLAFAMAPLFVSYFLFAGAYLAAYREVRGPPHGRPPEKMDRRKPTTGGEPSPPPGISAQLAEREQSLGDPDPSRRYLLDPDPASS